jgi:hypothetical protein
MVLFSIVCVIDASRFVEIRLPATRRHEKRHAKRARKAPFDSGVAVRLILGVARAALAALRQSLQGSCQLAPLRSFVELQ